MTSTEIVTVVTAAAAAAAGAGAGAFVHGTVRSGWLAGVAGLAVAVAAAGLGWGVDGAAALALAFLALVAAFAARERFLPAAAVVVAAIPVAGAGVSALGGAMLLLAMGGSGHLRWRGSPWAVRLGILWILLALLVAPSVAAGGPGPAAVARGALLALTLLAAGALFGRPLATFAVSPRARPRLLASALMLVPLVLLAAYALNAKGAYLEIGSSLRRVALTGALVLAVAGAVVVALGLAALFSTRNGLKPWVGGLLVGVPAATLAGADALSAGLAGIAWTGALSAAVGLGVAVRLVRAEAAPWRSRLSMLRVS